MPLKPAIAICVEPHDGVASNAEKVHFVTHWRVVRVSSNLPLDRNRLRVVIQAEDGDARGQNPLERWTMGE